MFILIDLVVLAIIGLFVFISAKKGFVKTFVETVGFVVAIVLAFSISGSVSEWAYNSFIEPPIMASVDEKLSDVPSGAQISVGLDDLPDFVVENAEKFGLSLEDFGNNGEDTIADGVEAVKQSVSDIVKPIATKIISALAFLILAIILIIAFKLLAKVLNKLFSFSVIGVANRLLGGILGGIKGVAVVTALCTIISFLATLGGGFLFFTDDVINGTILFKALSNIFTF